MLFFFFTLEIRINNKAEALAFYHVCRIKHRIGVRTVRVLHDLIVKIQIGN